MEVFIPEHYGWCKRGFIHSQKCSVHFLAFPPSVEVRVFIPDRMDSEKKGSYVLSKLIDNLIL